MEFIATVLGALRDAIVGIISLAPLWLPLMLLLLLVWFMFRAVQMMPRTKSAALKPDRGDTRVRWEDVAGVEEARAELQEVVEFLRDPRRFERLGARVPKGVLLHGPPGTGKTLLAKAVAGESGAAFFSQSASAFVEMFAGVGSSRIRKLFAAARKHAPAIVFIDELDAVGTARGGHSLNREQDQTLNQLLVELDGFADAAGVVVMASTNLLDSLDAALLRPGRFDRHVYVSPPDLQGRKAILEVHSRTKPLGDDVDLEAVARSTSGLTGADLENLLNESAIRAARADRLAITNADVDEALERVLAGLRTPRAISQKEKRIIAWHEAGHALVARLLIGPTAVHKVTIVRRGRALGYTMSLPAEERVLATREELADQIAILLAGRAAEIVAFGGISNGAADDLARSTGLARAMVYDWGMGELISTRAMPADDTALSEESRRLRDAEQARICDAAMEQAVMLLERHRGALDVLAAALLESETLDRADLDALLVNLPRESANADAVGRVRDDAA